MAKKKDPSARNATYNTGANPDDLDWSGFNTGESPIVAESEARTERTWGEAASDTGVGVVKGLAKGIHDLTNFGSLLASPIVDDDPDSGIIDKSAKWIDDKLQAQKSEVIQLKEQRLGAMIQDPNVSVSDVVAYVGSNTDLLGQITTESLPSLALGGLVTKGVLAAGSLAKVNAIRQFAASSKTGAALVGSIGESAMIGGSVYGETQSGEHGAAGVAMGVLTGALPGNVSGVIARRIAGKADDAIDPVVAAAQRGATGRWLAGDAIGTGTARAGIATATEAGQEFVQETSQALIEQHGKTGELDVASALKQGAVGAMAGGIMGGGAHVAIGEGAVASAAEIEAMRLHQQQAQQALAADPTNPVLQNEVESARAALAAATTTPAQRQQVADVSAAASATEIMGANDVNSAVDSFNQANQTSATMRTGAQIAEEAGAAIREVQGSYNPATAEFDTATTPAPATTTPGSPTPAGVTADGAAAVASAAPNITPDDQVVAPTPAAGRPLSASATIQASVPPGTPNADAILQVANWQAGRDPVTNISRIVAGMAGDPSETRITRPPGIAPVVWETFVRDAQRETGIMLQHDGGIGRTVRQGLQDIATGGSRPGRMLAERLLATNNPYLDLTIGTTNTGRGVVQHDGLGRVISMAMNPRDATESAFIHESLHALTLSWLYTVPQNDPMYRELKQLMNRVKSEANSRGMTFYGTHPGNARSERSRMAEFLAEAFTRSTFQTFLDSIQVESHRTGWDTFVTWVGRLIGTTEPRQLSALDLALRINDNVLSQSSGMAAVMENQPTTTAEPAPEPAPAVTPTPEPDDPYESALAGVVGLGWEPDAIADFEARSDADLQTIIDLARRPTAAEFARQIIARRAAQPAAAPVSVVETARQNYIDRQVREGMSQSAAESRADQIAGYSDSDLTRIREAEGYWPEAEVLAQAILAEHAAATAPNPTEDERAAATNAYRQELMGQGMTESEATSVIEAAPGFSSESLRRIAANPDITPAHRRFMHAEMRSRGLYVSPDSAPAATPTPAPTAAPAVTSVADAIVAYRTLMRAQGDSDLTIDRDISTMRSYDEGMLRSFAEATNVSAAGAAMAHLARALLNERSTPAAAPTPVTATTGRRTRQSVQEAATRFREIERQNGASDATIDRIMRDIQETVGNNPIADTEADIQALEDANAHSEAEYMRALLDQREASAPAAAPAQAMTLSEAVAALTAAENAYISEQMDRFGLDEQQAEQERDSIVSEAETDTDEEHQAGLVEWRRLGENAAADLSRAARQYNAVRRGNPPPAATPAPAAAPTPPAPDIDALRAALDAAREGAIQLEMDRYGFDRQDAEEEVMGYGAENLPADVPYLRSRANTQRNHDWARRRADYFDAVANLHEAVSQPDNQATNDTAAVTDAITQLRSRAQSEGVASSDIDAIIAQARNDVATLPRAAVDRLITAAESNNDHRIAYLYRSLQAAAPTPAPATTPTPAPAAAVAPAPTPAPAPQLTAAQRAARTRAQNRFIGYLPTAFGGQTQTDDSNRQNRSDTLRRAVTSTVTRLRRHPHAGMTIERDRAVRGLVNNMGADAAERWMHDRINAHFNTVPTIRVGGSGSTTRASDYASDIDIAENELLRVTGYPTYQNQRLSRAVIMNMTDNELQALSDEATQRGWVNTLGVVRAVQNLRAFNANQTIPHARPTPTPPTPRSAPSTSTTSSSNQRDAFPSRARNLLGTGVLERLVSFWRDVMREPGQDTMGDIDISDLIGHDTQASADELARRYNVRLYERAVEWARNNGEPAPPYQDVVLRISNPTRGARTNVELNTRGLARRGNPYVPQMTAVPTRAGYTWRQSTTNGASFDSTIHASSLAATPGAADLLYRVAADMARIKGHPGIPSDSILSTVNNLRRQMQSTAASLRTNNPNLINPLTSSRDEGPQAISPDIWNAASDEEKIGLNILRTIESVIGYRGNHQGSLGRIYSNLRLQPDGTFLAIGPAAASGGVADGTRLTFDELKALVSSSQSFAETSGVGGVGAGAASFAVAANTVLEALEHDINTTLPDTLIDPVAELGRANAGWFFSQDEGTPDRDYQTEIDSLMAEHAMPDTRPARRAEINAEIAAIQDEMMEMGANQPFDAEASRRMEGEYGRMAEAGAAFEAAGAGRAPNQTNTAAFKRWFGDSKVVDEDGNPLVVYHGTAATGITEFEGWRGVAGHFAFDQTVANDWADARYTDARDSGTDEEYSDGAVVYPAYIRAENIFDARNRDHLKKIGLKHGAIRDYVGLEENANKIKAAGFDSYYDFEHSLNEEPTGIAVFNPTQIKSAIGNRGTFDPESDNILYSMDEGVPSDPAVANSPAGQAGISTQPVSPASQNEIRIQSEQGKNWIERLSNRVRKAIQDKHVTLGGILRALKDTRALNAIDRFDGLRQSAFERLATEPMAAIESILDAAGISRADFENHLIQRHVREYNTHIIGIAPLQITRDPNDIDPATGQPREIVRGYDHETRPASGVDQNGEPYTTSRADAYMEQEHNPAMLRAAEAYTTMIRGLQEFAVESGLESRETIDRWNRMFPNYVPFRRDLDVEEGMSGTGSGFSVREGISQRAMGSTAGLVDPLPATLEMMVRVVDRGEKAKIGQTLLATARSRPIPMYQTRAGNWRPMWRVESMPNIRSVKRVRVYNVLDAGGQPILNGAGVPIEFYNGTDARAFAAGIQRSARQNQATGQNPIRVGDTGFHDRVVMTHNPAYINKDNVLVIPENGENHVLVFDEQSEQAMDMVRNLKNMDSAQLNGIFKIANVFSRWTVGTATGYNPFFAPINFIRDIQSSAINMGSTDVPGWTARDSTKMVADAVKNAPKLFRYLQAQHRARHDNGPQPLVDQDSPAEWMEFAKASGGLTGIRESFATFEEAVQSVQHLFGEGRTEAQRDPRQRDDWANTASEWASDRYDAFTRWLEGDISRDAHLRAFQKLTSRAPVAISNLNNAFELATRVAAFKSAFEKYEASGLSREEAAEKAAVVSKNVSVNFNRRGTMTSQMNALFPFFNAASQGSARLAELLFEKVATPDTGSGVGEKTRLTSMGKKVIVALPALGAMQAMMLAAAGFEDDQPPEHVRSRNLIIPTGGTSYRMVPLPLGLNALFNMGREGMDAILHPNNAPKHLFNMVTEPLTAFNPLGSTPNKALILSPAALDIPLALYMNEDAFGRQIFKEDRDPRRPTPGFTRHKEGTSQSAIAFAEALNKNTGGSDYKGGMIDITGDQVEYLLGQLGGGITREAMKTGQYASEVATGSKPSEDRPWYKVPLLGKFAGDVGDSSAIRDRLYKLSAELNALNAEFEGLKDGKDKAGAKALRAEHPELDKRDEVEKYFNAEAKLRKERTAAQRAGDNEKVAEINEKLRTKGEALVLEIEKIKERRAQ